MSSPNNADSPPVTAGLTEGATGEVATVVAIVLFLFTVITLILYIRAKHYPGIVAAGHYSRPPHHPRLDFAPNPSPPLRPVPLDAAVLGSLPVAVFRSRGFELDGGGPDCAVCLSELADGEAVRLLPKCGHGFHVGCIDMWFGSNSTCPLCRLPVGPAPSVVDESSSTNDVLLRICVHTNFDDDEGSSSTTCSSSSSSSSSSSLGKLEQGVVVIEIPSAPASSCVSGGETQVSSAIGEV
ncbi:RING-H2 finger protein ATL60-like [Iris pallida]|uniref:RING-type E3 ubiquitin transferase n=1 Tax=Iris pallida TaxID=29817 RepID=A0AAX6FKF9_IRIPA|nr:RING-H2 finger protein ATL60-like [Iris pallida]